MFPLGHREREKKKSSGLVIRSGVSIVGAVPQQVTYGLANEVQEELVQACSF